MYFVAEVWNLAIFLSYVYIREQASLEIER